MIRRVGAMAAVCIGFVSPAMAAGVAYNSFNAPGAEALMVQRGVSFSESFEAFALGSGIQNGWTSQFEANFTIVDSGIPGFGSRTAKHISDASTVAGFEMNGPAFAEELGGLYADVVLTGQSSVYQLITADNVNGIFNTRLNFNTDGTIDALQAVGGVGVFSTTTGTWSVDTKTRIGIVVLADGTLQVVQDGNTIFTGIEINSALGNTVNGVGQILTFSDNIGGASDMMLIDNINRDVPAPGGTVAIGLGCLMMGRRRR